MRLGPVLLLGLLDPLIFGLLKPPLDGLVERAADEPKLLDPQLLELGKDDGGELGLLDLPEE